MSYLPYQKKTLELLRMLRFKEYLTDIMEAKSDATTFFHEVICGIACYNPSAAKTVSTDTVGRASADKGLYADATLSILSNKNNPLVEVRFSDMFPVSLSALSYNQQATDVEYLTAEISFRYKLYEIVTL